MREMKKGAATGPWACHLGVEERRWPEGEAFKYHGRIMCGKNEQKILRVEFGYGSDTDASVLALITAAPKLFGAVEALKMILAKVDPEGTDSPRPRLVMPELVQEIEAGRKALRELEQ